MWATYDTSARHKASERGDHVGFHPWCFLVKISEVLMTAMMTMMIIFRFPGVLCSGKSKQTCPSDSKKVIKKRYTRGFRVSWKYIVEEIRKRKPAQKRTLRYTDSISPVYRFFIIWLTSESKNTYQAGPAGHHVITIYLACFTAAVNVCRNVTKQRIRLSSFGNPWLDYALCTYQY